MRGFGRFYYRIWLTAVPLLLGSARADDVQTAKLKEILLALQERQRGMNPIWVRYKLNRFESEAFQKAMKAEHILPNLRWDEEAEYAREGSRARSWLRSGHPSIPAWRQEDFRIQTADGSISRGLKEDLYVISKSPESHLVVETPLQLAGEELWISTLDGWARGRIAISTIKLKDEVDEAGERLLMVEVTSAKGYRTRCKLLSDYDFAVREIETFTDTGIMGSRSVTYEHDNLNGVAYPKRGRRDYFMTNSGTVGATTQFEVLSIETMARRIPDRLFQVDIPSDAWLWDADARVMVRNDRQSKTYLNEIIRRVGTRPLWRQWLGLFLLLACTGLTATILWQWFTVKR
jgi:hypothetical protein